MCVLNALCCGVEFTVLDDAAQTMAVRTLTENGSEWVDVPDDAFATLVSLGWIEFFGEGEFEITHTGKWHWGVWAKRREKEERRKRRTA